MSDESLISRLAIDAMHACPAVMLVCPVSGWGQANHAEAQFAGAAEDDSTLPSEHYIIVGMARAWMPDSVSKNDAAPLLQEAALGKSRGVSAPW